MNMSSSGLSLEEGKVLLRLARESIAQKLGLIGTTDVLPLDSPVFQEKRGTFVTLSLDSGLRGCIGNLAASESIADGVRRNALNAAFGDSRFRPLSAEEYARVQVELSILTEPQSLPYTDAEDLLGLLRPGIDGLVLRQGARGATFLPQVWEQLPEPADFLSHLCRKAGLAADAWRREKLEVSTYQVQHFEED